MCCKVRYKYRYVPFSVQKWKWELPSVEVEDDRNGTEALKQLSCTRTNRDSAGEIVRQMADMDYLGWCLDPLSVLGYSTPNWVGFLWATAGIPQQCRLV